MKNHLFRGLVLFAIFQSSVGCYFTQNPFADVNKLGTVLKQGESITIHSAIGPVTIEYIAPQKRRIIWNGESREFKVLKSSGHMGVFARSKFKQGPIKNIYGVSYAERTLSFRSEKELKKYLYTYEFEHRVDTKMVVNCNIYEYTSLFLKKRKLLFMGLPPNQWVHVRFSLCLKV